MVFVCFTFSFFWFLLVTYRLAPCWKIDQLVVCSVSCIFTSCYIPVGMAVAKVLMFEYSKSVRLNCFGQFCFQYLV